MTADVHESEFPDYEDWRNGFETPLDVKSYLDVHLSVTTAFLFTRLLFPEFIIRRGCVLVAPLFNEGNFEKLWSGGTDPARIEFLLNQLNLWDILSPDTDAEYRAAEVIAGRMAEAWRLAAQQQIPDRDLFIDASERYGPTVVLYSRPRDLGLSD